MPQAPTQAPKNAVFPQEDSMSTKTKITALYERLSTPNTTQMMTIAEDF